MSRGLFVTIEGGEGSGKSTQAELLVNHLHEEGYDVIATREPGGTRIGEQIRSITHNPENIDLDPITEAYLMAASRAQHVKEIIAPAIASGKIVICDRYLDSSLAYQGYGRTLGMEEVLELNKDAVNGTMPDITILLDIPPKDGLARRLGTIKKDRLDLEQIDFYSRVHAGYLDLAKKFETRYVVINATKSVEEVAFDIWNNVKTKLPVRDGKTNIS